MGVNNNRVGSKAVARHPCCRSWIYSWASFKGPQGVITALLKVVELAADFQTGSGSEMVQSCTSGGLEWMLGSVSLPREWSNAGTGFCEVVGAPRLLLLKGQLGSAVNDML